MRARLLPILAGVFAFSSGPVVAEDPVVPGEGFPASHYETLWTKSPFAVATADAAPESADYSLVGVAQFDGVYYASLIEKQSQEHFLVTSDKPAKGITLVSVTRGHTASDTLAVVQKDGQSITLKLEQAPPPPAENNPATMQPSSANPPNLSNPSIPQIPMPGAVAPVNPPQAPPPATVHPRIIRVPSPPTAQQFQPPPAPPAPAPNQ